MITRLLKLWGFVSALSIQLGLFINWFWIGTHPVDYPNGVTWILGPFETSRVVILGETVLFAFGILGTVMFGTTIVKSVLREFLTTPREKDAGGPELNSATS